MSLSCTSNILGVQVVLDIIEYFLLLWNNAHGMFPLGSHLSHK